METAVQPSAPETLERIEFTGTGGEYFRIWIVNLTLTILTLGIYSAWAKVRRLRYFHGSTRVAGHAFSYHATPAAILKGRLIAFAALVVYAIVGEISPGASAAMSLLFAIAMPLLLTRARIFQMRMTSWRGVRFEFDADYGGAFKVFLLAPIATALSLGTLAPWATRLRYRWLVDNSAYGNTYFKMNAGLKPFVLAVLGAVGIIIAFGLLFYFVGPRVLRIWFEGMQGSQPSIFLPLLFVVGFYLPFVIAGYALLAFWRRAVLNAVFPATTVGPLRLHCELSARRLAWIYLTNFLGIVATLGLFTPWARVRATKYQVECMGVYTTGPLDHFVATEIERASAVGEELGEMFDVDVQI